MKKNTIVRYALMAALLLTASVVWVCADAGGTDSFSFPLDTTLIGLNGETVYITGTIHKTIHSTINNNVVTINLHENYQNSSGVDLNTGNIYQVNSVNNTWSHISGEGSVDYMENQSVVMVSQGSAPNLTLHTVTHVNVSASGEASAEIVDMYLTN